MTSRGRIFASFLSQHSVPPAIQLLSQENILLHIAKGCIFAVSDAGFFGMETITLQYDANNKQAQSIIEMPCSIGLFEVCEKTAQPELTEEQEKEAFLYTSRVNAAKMFAQYL